MQIKCPKCSWIPQQDSKWTCEQCNTEINLFENVGECTSCRHRHLMVYCIDWEGGCGEMSPILDWCSGMDEELLKLNVKKLFD